MARIEDVESKISLITDEINNSHQNAESYIERAKLYLCMEQFDKALNDFITAAELQPNNSEIKEHVAMLQSIFNYRNIDTYNP